MGHASQQSQTQSMDAKGCGAASECLPTQVPTNPVSECLHPPG